VVRYALLLILAQKQFSRRDRETPIILAIYLDEALELCNPYINILQFSSVPFRTDSMISLII
jgi:hypothetical protein